MHRPDMGDCESESNPLTLTPFFTTTTLNILTINDSY